LEMPPHLIRQRVAFSCGGLSSRKRSSCILAHHMDMNQTPRPFQWLPSSCLLHQLLHQQIYERPRSKLPESSRKMTMHHVCSSKWVSIKIMAEKPSRGDKEEMPRAERAPAAKKKKKTQPMIRAGPGCQPETPLLPSSPPVSGGRQRCPAYPPLTRSMCALALALTAYHRASPNPTNLADRS
jgi:hypothetical protein